MVQEKKQIGQIALIPWLEKTFMQFGHLTVALVVLAALAIKRSSCGKSSGNFRSRSKVGSVVASF